MRKGNSFKFVVVLVLTVGSYIYTYGQPDEIIKPNSWRTMTGYSMYGGGNVSGITVMNEYNRYLTPHIRVAPNFKFSSATKVSYFFNGLNNQDLSFLSQQATILEFGAMGYYEYLNPNKSGLELGLGLFYRNLQWVIATGPNSEYIGSSIRIQENSVAEYSDNTIGFNISIGLIINISEIIALNFNGIIQSDTGNNTGFGGFGGLSVRF